MRKFHRIGFCICSIFIFYLTTIDNINKNIKTDNVDQFAFVIRTPTGETLGWDSVQNLYTDKQGRPFIWLYYHTTKLPAVLALSLATIRCHHAKTNIRIELVTNIYHWLHKTSVHPNFNDLSHVHQAD